MAEAVVGKEPAVENEEECLARHRKEKKELQVEIQKLKHSITKGDKKKKRDVTAQIAVLDAQLDEKHEKELRELRTRLMAVRVTDDSESVTADGHIDSTLENCNGTDENLKTEKKLSKTQRRRDRKAQKQAERDEEIRDQEILNEFGVRKIEENKINAALKARGLAVHEMPSDGNCLYASIADQLKQHHVETSIQSLRHQAAEYMRKHPDEFLPFLIKEGTGDMYSQEEYMTYCEKVASTSEWGGHTEIRALSDVLSSPIEIIQADGANIIVGENLQGSHLILSYHRHAYRLGEHYNSVIPLKDAEDDGFS